MTLDEYLASEHWKLPVGHVTPITGNWCKHCLSEDVYMEVRIEPTDPQGSLAGTQVKMTARQIYVLCCAACGRFSGDRRQR
jgi:hypothetical protein